MTSTLDSNKRDVRAVVALVVAVALAMLVANSPLGNDYSALLHMLVPIGIAPLQLSKNVLHWINDGFMAVFFLLVGIEIKRECMVGELSTRSRALLPVIAAFGGMLAPALVYVWFNRGQAETLDGWPIPTATDIAFAVGLLALLGSRVPAGLRVFLLALAVIDDLGAVVLIAILFTSDLSSLALILAAVCLMVLAMLNRVGVTRMWPYLLVGFLLWLSVLKSGVHATLAGVALGLAIPLSRDPDRGIAARLEHGLQPWVAFVILPLFALANAGVSLSGIGLAEFTHPVTVGVTLGLLVGKFVGVFGMTWLAVRAGIGALPAAIRWDHIVGVSLLTGIGFTMSLFIGSLAFPDDTLEGQVRLGVLLGSTGAAIAGLAWLRACGAAGPTASIECPSTSRG